MKDTYLFYKTVLNSTPQLAIGNREWQNRSGADDGSGRCIQPVPVFTNQPSVTLTLNGRKVGTKRSEGGVAMFDVPFVDGENRLVARAGALTDVLTVGFRLAQASPERFTELNVMLGSPRYFDDREAGLAWIPEQPYTPGSWGYVGGEVLRRSGTGFLERIAILGTKNVPVFQTQRVGIESFRADVPDGQLLGLPLLGRTRRCREARGAGLQPRLRRRPAAVHGTPLRRLGERTKGS